MSSEVQPAEVITLLSHTTMKTLVTAVFKGLYRVRIKRVQPPVSGPSNFAFFLVLDTTPFNKNMGPRNMVSEVEGIRLLIQLAGFGV